MDFTQLVAQRYSVRKYAERPVEPEKIQAVLEAGRLAPTAKNLQPQRIHVIQSPEALAKIREAVHCAFSHALEGKPVYLHCSGGKDRAGILAMLILTILGAEREAVLEDYLLTNESRDRHYDKEFQRFLRFADGNEELARKLTLAHRANAENLQAFYDSLEARYGGMEAFIVEVLQIDRHYRARLKERLTLPA